MSVQVFSEDKEGIICYQTKTGEIVCEGMDEGPHFYPASSLRYVYIISPFSSPNNHNRIVIVMICMTIFISWSEIEMENESFWLKDNSSMK